MSESLTEFLLARIAETQAAAEGFHSRDCYLFVPDHMQADPPECDCGVPARVLSECEAKRRIVEQHGHGYFRDADGEEYNDYETCGADCEDLPCLTIRALALPYADHDDYRKEWAP